MIKGSKAKRMLVFPDGTFRLVEEDEGCAEREFAKRFLSKDLRDKTSGGSGSIGSWKRKVGDNTFVYWIDDFNWKQEEESNLIVKRFVGPISFEWYGIPIFDEYWGPVLFTKQWNGNLTSMTEEDFAWIKAKSEEKLPSLYCALL